MPVNRIVLLVLGVISAAGLTVIVGHVAAGGSMDAGASVLLGALGLALAIRLLAARVR